MTDREQPLSGLRVLDFSWVWSGPLAAALLAEFGAQVIKVEHGQRLDNSRLRGRPLRDGVPVDGPSIETGPYFHQTNHDKLSITMNLKSPKVGPIVDRLVASSHVLLENLSPGALDRTGLGYERVSAINPRLVYLSMSAAGKDGPLANMRAYAPIMSSYCGFETMLGYADEEPMGMMNFGYGDPNAAIHAVVPLLAALYEAEQTGRGQHIDMSQIEAMLAVIAEPQIDWFINARDARPRGNAHPAMAPHGIYPVAGTDSWVSIAVADDGQWRHLVELMGRPDWAVEAALNHARGRLAQRTRIDAALADWTRAQDAGTLLAQLHLAGIAASRVQDIAAQQQDPQFVARATRQRAHHAITGEEWLYRTPWVMESDTPQIRASAPLLGQHNNFVFGHILGMSAQEIALLKEEGVLA